MTEIGDDVLVKRLAGGDARAMAELVARYEAPLRRYVARLCMPCLPWQDDLLQESFLKLYRNANDYDPGLKFSAWLYRIVHNVVQDHVRAQSRRPRQSVRFEESDEGEALFVGARFRPEERVERREFQTAVRAIVAKMPSQLRSAFVLRFFEDKEYSEIGDILQTNVDTVATWVRRARIFFKEEAKAAGLGVQWEDDRGTHG